MDSAATARLNPCKSFEPPVLVALFEVLLNLRAENPL
jgi:hypothetical protein